MAKKPGLSAVQARVLQDLEAGAVIYNAGLRETVYWVKRDTVGYIVRQPTFERIRRNRWVVSNKASHRPEYTISAAGKAVLAEWRAEREKIEAFDRYVKEKFMAGLEEARQANLANIEEAEGEQEAVAPQVLSSEEFAGARAKLGLPPQALRIVGVGPEATQGEPAGQEPAGQEPAGQESSFFPLQRLPTREEEAGQ